MSTHTIAIIVAGGSGTRAGGTLPKQFVEINKKPILAYTVDKFENSIYVREIVIVVSGNYLEEAKRIVCHYGYTKVSAVVEGGETRQQSVFNGLKHAKKLDYRYVLIHDAARPFVTDNDIRKISERIAETGCAILTVPVTDSVKNIDKAGNVTTLNRDDLYAVQTPQGFDLQLLLKAHEEAVSCGFSGYDDAVLTERIGVKTKLVHGGYHNFKITTAQDMILAKFLL